MFTYQWKFKVLKNPCQPKWLILIIKFQINNTKETNLTTCVPFFKTKHKKIKINKTKQKGPNKQTKIPKPKSLGRNFRIFIEFKREVLVGHIIILYSFILLKVKTTYLKSLTKKSLIKIVFIYY